ncbi:MAG: DNRLRE domain-containing protein [Armatimonadota bacterium]|jgi:hypothetical protein
MNIVPSVVVLWFGILALSSPVGVLAAPNDWAEGTPGKPNGATRDHYNRAGRLEWDNYMGDWRDARGVPQGNDPYSTATLVDDDAAKFVEWDVTGLVQEWVDGKYQNQGVFLRAIEGSGPFNFRSREHSEAGERPQLVITAAGETLPLVPVADTYLETSTYKSMGDSDTLRIGGKPNHALLRFDLSGLAKGTRVTKAVLRLFAYARYGSRAMTVGVFRCSQGQLVPDSAPIEGLASKYRGDSDIASDPDVIFADDFESPQWADDWSYARGTIDTTVADAARRFEPLQGKGLRVRIPEGSTLGMTTAYKFEQETGQEPEEIFFRYYLRFGDDWNQTLQGGKMPGISGTYGVAGWGGRKVDGTDGWSARGSFYYSIPDDNPLAGTTPIGTYCYHADMRGNYGNVWLWQEGYRGFLRNNRWYCVEQYLKMNTPGETDGIIRAWIDGRPAFEKTDIRFRTVDKLKIEQIWMNVYHGGTKPSPRDQHLFIDNVVIAKKYIGPMGRGAR